jgi:hypothetical protein
MPQWGTQIPLHVGGTRSPNKNVACHGLTAEFLPRHCPWPTKLHPLPQDSLHVRTSQCLGTEAWAPYLNLDLFERSPTKPPACESLSQRLFWKGPTALPKQRTGPWWPCVQYILNSKDVSLGNLLSSPQEGTVDAGKWEWHYCSSQSARVH